MRPTGRSGPASSWPIRPGTGSRATSAHYSSAPNTGGQWRQQPATLWASGGCRPPPNQGYLMERFLTVASGQMGSIARNESRQQVVSRLLELMREAKARGSDIIVFPE